MLSCLPLLTLEDHPLLFTDLEQSLLYVQFTLNSQFTLIWLPGCLNPHIRLRTPCISVPKWTDDPDFNQRSKSGVVLSSWDLSSYPHTVDYLVRMPYIRRVYVLASYPWTGIVRLQALVTCGCTCTVSPWLATVIKVKCCLPVPTVIAAVNLRIFRPVNNFVRWFELKLSSRLPGRYLLVQ